MKGFNSNEKQQLLLLHKPASNGGGGGASGGGGGGGGGGRRRRPRWRCSAAQPPAVAGRLPLLLHRRLPPHPPLHRPRPPPPLPPSTPTTVSVAVAVATSEPTATAAAAAKKEGEGAAPGLAEQVFDALVHYAAAANASARSMTERDMRAVAGVLRRRAPCNLLVFGLGPETALWRALNHGGRTVFLDENEYYIAHLERRLPGLEAYDVAYTTRVADLPDLLAGARASRAGDCRPVQDLLFSECRLALNDLPNHLYDVAWDVVLVDGPAATPAPPPAAWPPSSPPPSWPTPAPLRRRRRPRPRLRARGREALQRGVPLPRQPRRRLPDRHPRPLHRPPQHRRRILPQCHRNRRRRRRRRHRQLFGDGGVVYYC
uniref:Uncharacterized protein n=1 Tax=Ananas comosus var. bracteatus TaxID=296719 RepID=A0A6V7PA08_ANACO|nr:unnamed protein product [Ananas comosus var. bracteatus]